MAAILSSITMFAVVASSPIPQDSSLSRHPQNNTKMKPTTHPKADYKKQLQQQQQPSILEIERAIGAGIFRDRDANSGEGGEKSASMFDNILKNSVGRNEGSAEKRLRETGEWLIQRTDNTSRSAGKQILMFIFVWMIPLWVTAFLVATGLLRLPFDIPFLDDLIS